MHLTVRRATASDFEGVSRAFAEENALHVAMVPEYVCPAHPVLTPGELQEILARADRVLLVAEVNGEIVGTVLLSVDSSETERWIRPVQTRLSSARAKRFSFRKHSRGSASLPPTRPWSSKMCRNIRTLFNFEPPATDDEIRAASIQFVRKVSGATRPSKANEAAFERAVDEIATTVRELLDSLVTSAAPRSRETEAAKARARAAQRFGAVGSRGAA